jgi:predicted nucleotidyltransferase
MNPQIQDLPTSVATVLDDFLTTATRVSGENLKSAVLFGSAVEARLRPASDVNLILVYGEVKLAELDGLREAFGFAHSAIALDVLFIEESEVPVAAHAFAVKFSDIRMRHRVLLGRDVFADVEIGREATIARLKQVLINLTLRLRERYALSGQREEQHARLIADISAPVRACAAALLALEGAAVASPKEALLLFVKRLPERDWTPLVDNLAAARSELLRGQAVSATVAGLADLLRAMYRHTAALS